MGIGPKWAFLGQKRRFGLFALSGPVFGCQRAYQGLFRPGLIVSLSFRHGQRGFQSAGSQGRIAVAEALSDLKKVAAHRRDARRDKKDQLAGLVLGHVGDIDLCAAVVDQPDALIGGVGVETEPMTVEGADIAAGDSRISLAAAQIDILDTTSIPPSMI